METAIFEIETLAHIKLKDKEKNHLKYKRRYLNLQFIITQHQLAGEMPPKKLIAKARYFGHLAEIKDEELNNL